MKLNRKIIIITIAAIAVTLGAVYALSQKAGLERDSTSTNNTTGTATNNSGQEATKNTDELNNNMSENPQTPQSPTQQLPKPSLSKSSGNNGSIPSGILVNFICEAKANSTCEVTLTDKNDVNRKINLSAKRVVQERGVAFASWDWTSVSGTWKVVARVSEASYKDNFSDEQELVVR